MPEMLPTTHTDGDCRRNHPFGGDEPVVAAGARARLGRSCMYLVGVGVPATDMCDGVRAEP